MDRDQGRAFGRVAKSADRSSIFRESLLAQDPEREVSKFQEQRRQARSRVGEQLKSLR
jgi:hypothetical protein